MPPAPVSPISPAGSTTSVFTQQIQTAFGLAETDLAKQSHIRYQAIHDTVHSAPQETSRHGTLESTKQPIRKDPRNYSRRKQRKQTFWNRTKDLLYGWWLCELVFILVSIAAAIAVVAILLVYHDRALSQWPYRITINTTVSVMMVICKASMLLPVTQAMSQLKWHWFTLSSPRVLNDIQFFDDASRGPLGAGQLLLKVTRLHLASMGASIIIVAIAMDPFAQQLLSFPQKPVPGDPVAVGRALNFTSSGVTYYQMDGLVLDDSSLSVLPQTYMLSAIYSGTFGDPTPLRQSCPTQHCTWPDFWSLSFCTQCETGIGTFSKNMSENMGTYISPSNITWSIPLMSSPIWTSNVGPFIATNSSTAVAGIGNPIFGFARFPQATISSDQTFESLSDAEGPHVNCTECALLFCVKRFSLGVNNGIPSVRMGPGIRNEKASGNSGAIHALELESAYTYSSSLSSYFSQQFNTSSSKSSTDLLSQLSLAANVTEMMDNIATSMTYALMNDALNYGSSPTYQQQGASYKEVTFIYVHWPWLILPVSLVLGALIFLLLVILQTSRRGIVLWKTSILATLFHRLELSEDQQISQKNEVAEMKTQAQAMRMQLLRTDGLWTFVAWPDKDEKL